MKLTYELKLSGVLLLIVALIAALMAVNRKPAVKPASKPIRSEDLSRPFVVARPDTVVEQKSTERPIRSTGRARRTREEMNAEIFNAGRTAFTAALTGASNNEH